MECPSEPDTPSRKSYISSTDSGESVDSGSEFEPSDRDERHNYVGYEEAESSDSDILTEEEDALRFLALRFLALRFLGKLSFCAKGNLNELFFG